MNNIRIRFTRGEEVKFISHLDLMKAFERTIRRSGLPIAYSLGYNPHPQMVFGLPLSVGVTSDGEFADFEMVEPISAEGFMEGLNKALPQGIGVTAASEKKTKANIMATVSGADYRLELFLNEALGLEEAVARMEKMIESESIPVLKEGKGTAKEIDIRPMILGAKLDILENKPFGYESYGVAFAVHTRFSAGSRMNLRPELFVRALSEQAGIPVATSRLHREMLYVDHDGKLTDPLDKAVLEGV